MQNMAVLKKVAALAGDEAKKSWGHDAIARGFQALEPLLADCAGRCSVGDDVTMADCCLVPQIYNANR